MVMSEKKRVRRKGKQTAALGRPIFCCEKGRNLPTRPGPSWGKKPAGQKKRPPRGEASLTKGKHIEETSREGGGESQYTKGPQKQKKGSSSKDKPVGKGLPRSPGGLRRKGRLSHGKVVGSRGRNGEKSFSQGLLPWEKTSI